MADNPASLMGAPVQVAVVEDDRRIRDTLKLLLDASEGFQCAGVCSSAEEAIALLPGTSAKVALMDINLPGLSGVDCVRHLQRTAPELLVVMLTVYDDSDQIFQALEAGASGYLLKRTPPQQILQAITEVLNGGAPMSSYIARKVVQSFQRKGLSQKAGENLTPREEEILQHVARGYINKEIAEALSVSVETVRTHLKSIYEKLHVRSRTEAVMRFVQK